VAQHDILLKDADGVSFSQLAADDAGGKRVPCVVSALWNSGSPLPVSSSQPIPVTPGTGATWTVQPGNTANTTPWLFKLGDGTNTVSLLNLTNSKPLPVAIVDASGNQLVSFGGGGGGTQYAEGTTQSTATGTALLWKDAGNVLRVPSASNPLPISGTITLPTGQALAANSTPVVLPAAQVTALTPLATVTANLGTLNGVATDTVLQSVRDRFATAQALSDSLSNPTTTLVGSSNLVWDVTNLQWTRLKQAVPGSITSLTGITNIVNLGRYNATPPSLSDGDFRSLQLDSNGRLLVSIPTGGATSALQTTGNTSLSNIDGKLPAGLTVASGRLVIDGSAVTQPVSGTLTTNETVKTTIQYTGTVSTSGDTTLIAAPGAGQKIVIVSYTVQNESGSSTVILLKDGSTTKRRLWTEQKVDGESKTFPFNAYWRLSTNSALAINLSGANQVGVSIDYFIE
jgi:hypothetical protein